MEKFYLDPEALKSLRDTQRRMDMSPTDKLKAREGDHGQGDRLNQKKYFSPIRNASVSP